MKVAAPALPGISIHRAVLGRAVRDAVLRMLHLHLRLEGLPPAHALAWAHDPFISLRARPEAEAVVAVLEQHLQPAGRRTGPVQFVYHLPDDVPEDYPLTFHVDQPPAGERYTAIVGVAFTSWNAANGSVHVACPSGSCAVDLHPGDAFVMHPGVSHSPGLNRSALPRIGLYARWSVSAGGKARYAASNGLQPSGPGRPGPALETS